MSWPKKFNLETEQKIIADYQTKKYTQKELAIKYSCNPKTISKILKDNNIEIISHWKPKNQDLIENYFEIIDNANKAYYIGFLFCDGNISNNEFILKIAEKDRELLENLRKDLNSNGKISTQKRGNSTICTFAIKSESFCNYLAQYGIIPNKTKNIKNLCLDKIPDEYKIDYLRGLIDGDGWICNNERKQIGFVSYYKSTVEDFVTLLNFVLPTDNQWNNKILTSKDGSSRVQIQKKSQIEFLAKTLYKNAERCLSRKKKIASSFFDVTVE